MAKKKKFKSNPHVLRWKLEVEAEHPELFKRVIKRLTHEHSRTRFTWDTRFNYEENKDVYVIWIDSCWLENLKEIAELLDENWEN